MAITEASRHQLHTRLKEVLGPEEATVLMEHLPPVGWADVATRRDLDGLEARMDAGFAAGKQDLEILDSRLEARFERSMRELQRNLFFGIVTMQTAFLGIVLAIVR